MIRLKKLLCLAASISIFTTIASGCNMPGTSSKNTINVFNWGEYIDQSILKDFTNKTGIRVNYQTYATNEEMYEKVKSGTNNYDLICPSDYMLDRMRQEKLLQKIDFKNIPNYKNIDDKYKSQSYDKTNEYSIPYMWGTIGILYDKQAIKDNMDSWNVLWNPKYKGKIFMSDDMRNSIGVSLLRLGYSINTTDSSQIKKAANELMKQRSLVNPVYIGDQVKDSMRSGEKEIAVMYSGDAEVLKNENPSKYEYVIPKEGTNIWFDCWAIPKDAKNKAAAEKFLNYLLDAKVNKKNVDEIGYATPNKATLPLLSKKLTEDKTAYPGKSVLDKCQVFTNLDSKTRSIYSDAWLNITSK